MDDMTKAAADLLSRTEDRPLHFKRALSKHEEAVARHHDAVAQYGAAETLKLDQARLDEIDREQVGPAASAVVQARQALSAAPTKSPTEALKKVQALLDEAMDPEEVTALRDDIARALNGEEDPVVETCKRWLRIETLLAERSSSGFTDLEWEEYFEQASGMLRNIERSQPATLEGLALMLTVYWHSTASGLSAGAEGWDEEIMRPEVRFMANIRNGAYELAGLQTAK